MMRRVILRNVLSNWVGMAVNTGVAFLMMPFVIRELGNSGYGFWALLQAVISYMFLLDLGLRSALNRHLARVCRQGGDEEANQVLNTGLVVYTAVCVLVMLLSGLLAVGFGRLFPVQELARGTVVWSVVLVGGSVALRFPAAVFDAVLTGLQRYDLLNAAHILGVGTRTALIILVLRSGYGVVAVAWVTLLTSVLLLLASYFLAAWVYPAMRLELVGTKIGTLRLLANHGMYAYVLVGATRVVTEAGTVIVGAFLGSTAVTFYAIAQSLTTHATSVISGITTTIPPAASDLEARRDWEGLRRLCIGGSKFVLLIGLPILVTLMVSGETFVTLWIGHGFEASYPPLVLLSAAWAFNYLQSGAACVLIGLSRHRVAAWLALVQAALNVGGSLLLVEKMGMVGVASGALIASAVMNTVFQVHALRLLGVSPRAFFTQAIAPALIALVPFVAVLEFLLLWSPPMSLVAYFIQVAVAACGTLVLLPWVSLSQGERELMWRSVGRLSEMRGLST